MRRKISELSVFVIPALVMGVLLVWCASCFADINTATLTITPSPCKRGDVLHFTGSVFYTPTAHIAPGTTCYGGVSLDNSSHPELSEWHSAKQVFKYPAPGQKTAINFTSTYTVPQDFKGSDICFYMTEGQSVPRRISYKFCIIVKPTLKPLFREKIKVTPLPQ